MFGFGKKPKVKPNKVIAFCEQADDALTLAYEQGDIQAAVPYFHYPLLDYLVEEIQSGKDLTQELGLKKYRLRTWTILHESDTLITLKKQIRHQDVKIRGMVSIPVGDNVDEEWDVDVSTNKYGVENIRRLERVR